MCQDGKGYVNKGSQSVESLNLAISAALGLPAFKPN